MEAYELDLDEHDEEFANSQNPYELGKDEERDRRNCELYWAWQKFETRCREERWSGIVRNRNLSGLTRHLRDRLGKSHPEDKYLEARRKWEERHR